MEKITARLQLKSDRFEQRWLPGEGMIICENWKGNSISQCVFLVYTLCFTVCMEKKERKKKITNKSTVSGGCQQTG